ncbi:MAG: NAD(P)/FAD-dependent oxidoreductase [Desulfotignum sp.]|nr:NAD(P)/FAD-dependent oxidoreductase [Desulfotignum sp.]
MIHSDVIIVGGGPAGSACAARLKKNGVDARILDKQVFPRKKLCAGWVSPDVFDDLECSPETYPHALTRIRRIHFHLFGIPMPVKTHQYAVRRIEFDHWLIRRAGVSLHTHPVKTIQTERSRYVIDDRFECQYLVGAGGTHCPVRRAFMEPVPSRPDTARIAAVEKEFLRRPRVRECHIWYLENGLPGYAWYLPKKDGWINIGIGGKQHRLNARGTTIMDHWRRFLRRLIDKRFLDRPPGDPAGHTYYLRHAPYPRQAPEKGVPDNVFVIGDAAGLSTLDMGEGIHAAVQSGLAAADAIISGRPMHLNHISRFSLPALVKAGFYRG